MIKTRDVSDTRTRNGTSDGPMAKNLPSADAYASARVKEDILKAASELVLNELDASRPRPNLYYFYICIGIHLLDNQCSSTQ
uniref:Uncharacterized protein n=1 Tax=Romanomermis culicivorax TaxID=13658 RepID=A0A915IW95_ROMCU